jgi:AcrR family transcriptional regulator
MTGVVDDVARAEDDRSDRGGRVARNRQRRTDQFLRAGLQIVTEEGFEALTMNRLSDELDTAVGSVYRYFPSKGHLVTAIQAGAIERLTESYDNSVDPVVDVVVGRSGLDPVLVRLVVVGRWFCEAAEVLPEEVRLLQMINVRRRSMLADDGGEIVLRSAMSLLQRVADVIGKAEEAGIIRPGPALARTVAWAAALGGVLAVEDLGRYLPGIAGEGRLGRQHNVDLCCGWGADGALVDQIDGIVDEVARSVPLARR